MTTRIPPAGLIGELALREAAASSFQDIIRRVENAIRALFVQAGTSDTYVYLRGLWPDQAVVSVSGSRSGGDRLLSYPYSLAADGTVTLGAPVEVVETFTPLPATMREAAGSLLEAADGGEATPGKFKVRIIRAGLSGNGNFYPVAVLREAVPLFDGARVFVKSDAEHIKGGGKDLRNLVGQISGAVFVEGASPDSGEVQGVLTLIDPTDSIGVKLREAVARNLVGLFGLSIDAEGTAKTGKAGGRAMRMATAITKVRSVDLIVEPGAGGGVISLIEAKDDDMALRARMIEAIQATRPALLDGKDPATLTDDALEAIFVEALSATPATATPAPVVPPVQPTGDQVRLIEARLLASLKRTTAMRERVARSTLPPTAQARIIAEFEAKADFREAEVEARIRDEVAYLAPFARGGTVMDLGDDPTISGGQSRGEKFREALDAFWDPEHKDHGQARSIKDLYVLATGDRMVTGRKRDCDRALYREALDGDDFASVFLDSMNKRMIAVYRQYAEMESWRDLATVVPVNDFREQSRVRWGGYGDLPVVEKNDPYLELDSPQEDDPAKYKVKKRGRLESIGIEDIKNDDVGFIRWIPTGLGRASKRTLSKFILDFLRTNPTYADGKALFHADHGNLITDPLSSAGYKNIRLKMKRQTDASGTDTIGVNPKFLWVPDALEETAYNLFTLGARNDPDFVATLKPTIRPVWYWTDENDWAVSADPLDIPTIEVGFLDGNQEPELWTQDSPTSGSLFSNDQITWKIRHTYGATALDYRGLAKSVVPA